MKRKRPQRTDTPAPANAWEAPGMNPNLRGRPLLTAMERAIAKLEGERQLINAQNKELRQRAVRAHDHHKGLADGLHQHITATGVGTEPTAEDAYGAHKGEQARADDLLSLLTHQINNFSSKTDPKTPPTRISMAQAPSSEYGEPDGGVSASVRTLDDDIAAPMSQK